MLETMEARAGLVEGALLAPRIADPGMLEQVVGELREIERRSGIDRTIAIGELVLTRFFGGNPAAWRDRRRNKNNSIRRLAARSDCPFSKSALHEAVGVYVGVLAFPNIRAFGHISTSHVASVLPLPESTRVELLERAELGRWSVRELRQNVVSLRRLEGERRGRPAVEGPVRAMGTLRKCVNHLNESVLYLAEAGPLDAKSRRELSGLAQELSQLTARLFEFEESTRSAE
jgi:hypothetical protein